MIHLAYDGSINGDWVAWYALNLARCDPDRRLRVVYIDTGEIDVSLVFEKMEALANDCEHAGIVMESLTVPSTGMSAEDVFQALRGIVPSDPETLMVCGARLNAGTRGYLAGTVSEKLLGDRSFPVMAVRVVQPGLLGAPMRFLMPVSGDRAGFLTGAKILKRFGPGVSRVNLLRVMQVQPSLFRHLNSSHAQSLRESGWSAMQGLDEELAEKVGIDAYKVDVNVTVSDDWAQELIISAGRHKSHLILMEAARQDLGAGYLYGSAIEVVLRNAPCDIALYRGG